MEHWLPLFEEKLATLFDHLGEHDVIVRDAGTDGALEARHEAIDDYFANRERAMVVRAGQLSPARARRRSIWRSKEWTAAVAERPIHLASPFPQPESDKVIDFGVDGPRDFAPERAQNANVYEAVAKHVAKLRKDKQKGRPRQLHDRRARAPCRAARGPWPQER